MFQLCDIHKGSFEDFIKSHKIKEWRIERKYDGERIMAFIKGGDFKFVNRKGNDKTLKFIDCLHDDYRERLIVNMVDGVVLDGEVVGKNFNAIQRRSKADDKVIEHLKELYPVKFVAFDILFYNGKDLRNKPLKERLKLLDKIGFRRAEALKPKTAWKQVEKNNWEGLVVKKLDSKYEARRSPNWVKIKKFKEEIVDVAGHEKGTGSGTFIVDREGRQERVNCPSNSWLKYWKDNTDAKLKVRYLEETKSGKMRFSVPVGWV